MTFDLTFTEDSVIKVYAFDKDGNLVGTPSQTVKVIGSEITEIKVKQPPKKLTYVLGESLDTEELIVEAVYSDAVEKARGRKTAGLFVGC